MAATAKAEKLSADAKAAVLLVALGPEIAAEVYKFLKEDTLESITLQLANLQRITPEEKFLVLEEAYQMLLAQEFVTQGGIEYARELLERALGPSKADEIFLHLQGSLQVTPFDFIKKTDPKQILSFIQNEHPQTIALILAHLDAAQAGAIISGLPAELQTEVARRIAILDRATPDVIMEIERVLEKKISSVFTQEMAAAGGVRALAEVLNRVDRSTEKTILEKLEEQNPELADEVKRLMFTFDDLLLLDDRSIQIVLRQVDQKDLPLALKGASEDVKNKILRNVSQRARAQVLEDMEIMGPVRLKNTEEAQQRIVNIIRQLEETGEIVVARGGEAELFV